MLGSARKALLSSLLLAAAMVPSGAFASLGHSSMHRHKRANDGSECYQDYAKDPKSCPIVKVAFFEDTNCATPLALTRTTSGALIKGNEQLLFDGAVAHSLKKPFGSMRVLAAVQGIGIGFAKEEESDMVVQNMAWMSSAQTYDAFRSKTCVTFPNLDVGKVGVWTAKFDDSFNQQGYVWNPYNIPIKPHSPQCSSRSSNARHKRAPRTAEASHPVCLEQASWGGGGVLMMYTTDTCQPDPKNPNSVKMQLYSTAQCTPLHLTGFNSYRAIQPRGATIDTVFSPTYYDLGESGYHACAQRDVVAKPFKPNECQKMSGGDMFVGVYGNDPQFPQAPPGKGDKVLRQGHGGRLLGPKEDAKAGSRPRITKP